MGLVQGSEFLDQPRFSFMPKILLTFILLSLIIPLACRKKEKVPFGQEDSLSVSNQIKVWRDTLKHYQFLEFSETPLILTGRLFPNDTIYQGKGEIRKIAHLLSFWRMTQDTFHLDSLLFFVDSLNPKDTFCSVIYNDFTRHTIAIFQYDSLWLIRFRDSVSLETVIRIGYSLPQEREKVYPLTGRRCLLFKKENGDYKLQRLSGFTFSYPKDSAPGIKSVSLSQEGRSVTISRDEFGKPIILDSLPSFRSEEPIVVNVICEEPSDTLNIKYFGFLYKKGERQFLGEGYNFNGSLTFSRVGISHLFIEIIPAKNILYPDFTYYYTILALPLRITH
jgi:hypothetical protein